MNELEEQIQKLIIKNPDITHLEVAKKLNLPADSVTDLYLKQIRDDLIIMADKTSKEIMSINLNVPNIEDKYGKSKLALMKMRQDESQFIRETLAKDVYSKRSEVTGKNGDAIKIASITFEPPTPNKVIDIKAE